MKVGEESFGDIEKFVRDSEGTRRMMAFAYYAGHERGVNDIIIKKKRDYGVEHPEFPTFWMNLKNEQPKFKVNFSLDGVAAIRAILWTASVRRSEPPRS